MSRLFIIVAAILIVIDVNAQNYFFNKSLSQCLKEIMVKEKTSEIILEKKVDEFMVYHKIEELIKKIKKGENKKINLRPYTHVGEKGELNLCKSCLNFKNYNTKIVNDLHKYEKEFNSNCCINPELEVEKGKPVLEIKVIQPVELSKNRFLIILSAKKCFYYLQQGKIIGINLIKRDAEEYYYGFIVEKGKVVFVKKFFDSLL